MIYITVYVLENGPMRWQIAQLDCNCNNPRSTLKSVMVRVSGHHLLRRIQWRDVKCVYEFDGQIISPNTMVKTLWQRAFGRVLKLRLLLSRRGGPVVPDGDLARTINADLLNL